MSIFQRLPGEICTPGSMNRLFSDFFRKFEGVILEVFGTIWEGFWEENRGQILGENPSEVVNETI